MSFFYILFFFITIKIITNQEIKNNTINKDFNRDFNHIYFKQLIVYCGTKISYLKFNFNTSNNSNLIIEKDDDKIQFLFLNEKKTYCFNSNTTLQCLDNNIFLFSNETNNIYLNYSKNNVNFSEGDNVYDISFLLNKNNISLKISYGDIIFIEYYHFSFILIFFGCFSILYGTSHPILLLIPHCTFFLYFLTTDVIGIISTVEISNSFIYLYLFFCFLTSILIIVFFRKKNMIVKCIHGGFFGFSLLKILIYYYIFLNLQLNLIDDSNTKILIYFSVLTIFIALGLFLNLFEILKEHAYLPCSAVSGSLYLMKGLGYIIGGYFSDIIFLNENLEVKINNYSETKLTYLIIHILIIIFSIFFQINRLKYNENKDKDKENLSARPTRIVDSFNSSSSFRKEKHEELVDKNNDENNETLKEEENEIDDKED